MTARSSEPRRHRRPTTARRRPRRSAPGARRRTRATAGRRPRPGRRCSTTAGVRLVAGQLDEVADQGGELLDLGAYVVEQLGARPRSRPPAPSAWAAGRGWCAARSAAYAARGRRRRPAVAAGRGRRRATASISLNAVASRAISSSPSTGIGVRSSVRAISSTAAVRRRTGRRPLRATPQPASRGADHAGQAEEQHHQRRAWRARAPAARGTGRGRAPGPASRRPAPRRRGSRCRRRATVRRLLLRVALGHRDLVAGRGG